MVTELNVIGLRDTALVEPAGAGWFADLDAGMQDRLLAVASERNCEPGQALYRVGDTGGGVFGVIDGWITLGVAADHGQETLVHSAGPGFWIGDLALLSERTRLMTISAVNAVRFLFIPAERVEEMLAEDIDRLRDFYRLSNVNTRTGLRIMGMDRVNPADRRLGLRLLHLLENCPMRELWLPLSQELLAELCAMSLSTAQRALSRLTAAGYVKRGYGGLKLCDREGLTQYCRGDVRETLP